MTQYSEELDKTAYHEAGHAVADAPIGHRFMIIALGFDREKQRFDGEVASEPNWRVQSGNAIITEDYLMQNFAGIVAQEMRAQECDWPEERRSWDLERIVPDALSEKYAEARDNIEREELIEARGLGGQHDTLCRNAIIEAFTYLSQSRVWAVVCDLAKAALNTYDTEAQEGKLEWGDLKSGLRERLEALETKSKRA